MNLVTFAPIPLEEVNDAIVEARHAVFSSVFYPTLTTDVAGDAVVYAITGVRYDGVFDPVTGFGYTDPRVKEIVRIVAGYLRHDYKGNANDGFLKRVRLLERLASMQPAA